MHLELPYKETELARLAKGLLHSCYALTQSLPEPEGAHLSRVLRESALGAYLGICRGLAAGKKKSRHREFRQACRLLVVVDAILECLQDLGMATSKDLNDAAYLLISVYNLLKKAVKNA